MGRHINAPLSTEEHAWHGTPLVSFPDVHRAKEVHLTQARFQAGMLMLRT